MFQLFALIASLFPRMPSQQQLDQDYLNQATDIYDVERRIAEIDHRMARGVGRMGGLGGALQ